MKDYYKILGVEQNCTEEEIRKKYRKLAMQYHPDRNPDDPAAEDMFKEVAEAYGVLTDPVKKRQYDACRASGTPYENGNGGFSYSQEDILKDLFRDPRFQQMFTGLLREFQRSGFRHNSTFVRKSFFGGKGGAFIGGIFLVGSMAVPLLTGAAKKTLSGKSSFFRSAGNVVGTLMGKGKKNVSQAPETNNQQHNKDLDTTYHTPLTAKELKYGKTIEVIVFGDKGEQTLKVTIPPDSKSGQKLRLRGKGRSGPLGRGDLFLHLVEKTVEG